MSDTVPMQLAGYAFQVAENLHEMLDGALIDAITFMRYQQIQPVHNRLSTIAVYRINERQAHVHLP